MREAKTDASCFEEIRPAGNLASETVHLLDSTQRCRKPILIDTEYERSCSPALWRRRPQVLKENNSTIRESDPFGQVRELRRDVRPIEWSVIVGRAVAWKRCVVTHVHPRFDRATTPFARDLLIRRAPGQPYRVRSHTWSNLSFTDQCLIPGRKTLVYFRMLGNSRSGSCTTA